MEGVIGRQHLFDGLGGDFDVWYRGQGSYIRGCEWEDGSSNLDHCNILQHAVCVLPCSPDLFCWGHNLHVCVYDFMQLLILYLLQKIGFTTHDPDRGSVPKDASKCSSNANYWILYADTVYHHDSERKVKFNICNLNVGDSVGCRVTKDGSLAFYVNDVSIGVGWENLPTTVPLWGFADVCGRTTKIKSEFCFGECLAHMPDHDKRAPKYTQSHAACSG